MAGSSDANNVPEGTILVFGSWACTADGSDNFSSHLITLKAPESKISNQSAETDNTTELGGNQALLELDSDITENVSTPTRIYEPAESDTNCKSKKLNFPKPLENTWLI